MSKLYPTKTHNPCPVCNDTSGDCRVRDELVLCHHAILGQEHSLWQYVRPTTDGIWGVFKPRQDDATAAEIARQKLIQQEKREARLAAQYEKWREGLTVEERDKNFRLLATVGLRPEHRALLHQRGLTDSQIAESLYFSVSPKMAIPDGVNNSLPGVKDGHLATKRTGYACVAFDYRGRALGFQIRDENPDAKNKYTWAKGTMSSHLQNGELPLSVCGDRQSKVFLCEGTQKPRIAAYRLGQQFIGASGGHFSGSILQLKATLGACRNVVLCPDAGDVLNPHTIRRWDATLGLFNFSYRVQIAWWGQFTKDCLDIDELPNLDVVQFLTPSQWRQRSSDPHQGSGIPSPTPKKQSIGDRHAVIRGI